MQERRTVYVTKVATLVELAALQRPVVKGLGLRLVLFYISGYMRANRRQSALTLAELALLADKTGRRDPPGLAPIAKRLAASRRQSPDTVRPLRLHTVVVSQEGRRRRRQGVLGRPLPGRLLFRQACYYADLFKDRVRPKPWAFRQFLDQAFPAQLQLPVAHFFLLVF